MLEFLKKATAPVSPGSARMTDDPRHVAALKQYNLLSETLSAVHARRREIELIRLAHKAPAAPTAADRITDALQLAAGGEITLRAPKQVQELAREDDALAKQEAALKDAITLNPVIQTEQLLSAEFAQTLQADHRALQEEYTAALALLGELELRERALLMRGASLGYRDVTLPGRLRWAHLGEIDDPNSALSNRLKNMGE